MFGLCFSNWVWGKWGSHYSCLGSTSCQPEQMSNQAAIIEDTCVGVRRQLEVHVHQLNEGKYQIRLAG